MRERIEPALSAEEWARPMNVDLRVETMLELEGEIRSRHAIAALALYGQPFGFTRDDVDNLRGIVLGGEVGRWLESLADRIEALLPPKEEQP